MAGEAYRAAFAEDPGYGGFGYDRGDGTCVLFFKEDAMPDVKLEPGFKLAACRYSLAELETGLAKSMPWPGRWAGSRGRITRRRSGSRRIISCP